MSHMVILVLMPAKVADADIEEKLAKMMKPYDEARTVKGWMTDCYCKSHKARIARNDFTKPMYDAARAKMQVELPKVAAKYGVNPDDYNGFGGGDERLNADMDTLWTALTNVIHQQGEDFEKAHPEYNKADPACSNCKGKGVYKTTSNPEGWWDWYSIGGRWAGYLPTGKDICTTEELLEHKDKSWIPYALLTADGKWHQRGEMLMFGCSNDKLSAEDWGTEVLKLVQAHPNHKVIVVDCHT